MSRKFRSCAGVLTLTALAAIMPAHAQFPASERSQVAPSPTAAPKNNPSALAITGNWSGQLNQVGSGSPYKIELSISAKEAATKYPDLDCAGKLTRVGSSKSYVFFIEIITKGSFDGGGHCPDGTITIARQGDNLALSWFGSIRGNTVVAYGTLSKN